jgi:putative zinc finger protein
MVVNEHTRLETACKDFEEDLVLYYYGDCSEADRRRVGDHLKECSRCNVFVADLRKLLPQMAKSAEVPPSFWDNYYREMVAKLAVERERKHWWRNLFEPLRVWMLPAFGTATVAVLAIGLVVGQGVWKQPMSQPQERIPQEIMADTNQLEFFNSLDMLESLPKLEELDGSKNELRNKNELPSNEETV